MSEPTDNIEDVDALHRFRSPALLHYFHQLFFGIASQAIPRINEWLLSGQDLLLDDRIVLILIKDP
jgi:hypothetical protein